MPTLDWIGKKAVVNHHHQVPYPCPHAQDPHGLAMRQAGLAAQHARRHATQIRIPATLAELILLQMSPEKGA